MSFYPAHLERLQPCNCPFSICLRLDYWKLLEKIMQGVYWYPTNRVTILYDAQLCPPSPLLLFITAWDSEGCQHKTHTHTHTPGGFKPWKCIVSQFWSLEVQNQGVGRTMLYLKASGEDLFLPLPTLWQEPAIRTFLALQLYHSNFCLCHPWAFFLCACVRVSSPLIRAPVILD